MDRVGPEAGDVVGVRFAVGAMVRVREGSKMHTVKLKLFRSHTA